MEKLRRIPIDLIEANPQQPRKLERRGWDPKKLPGIYDEWEREHRGVLV